MTIKICTGKKYGFDEFQHIRPYRLRSSRGRVAGDVHIHSYIKF